MRSMNLALRIALLLFLSACSLPVAAQASLPGLAAPAEPAPPADGDADGTSGVRQPILLADLPARADTDERFVNLLMLRASGADPTSSLVPRLQSIEASLQRKSRQLNPSLLRSLPILRLESLDRHWGFDARQFAAWKAEFNARTGPFANDAADASGRLAQWRATRVALPPDALPAALSARIDDLIAELEGAEQALSAPLVDQIALGRRANQLDAAIQAGQQAVTAAIAYIDSRLLHLDAPPLWRAQPDDGQRAVEAIARGVEVEATFVRDYSAANVPSQRILNLFQLLLLGALLWLWRWARRNRYEGMPEESVRVLRRPLSCWILLAMIGNLVFASTAPLMLQQTAMIVALVPVLRLLPAAGRRLLGWWPYKAVLFYLLVRLAILLVESGLVYRWYMLSLATGSIVAVSWLLWRGHAAASPGESRGALEKVVRAIAWGGVAGMVLAVLSNVLGNVSLAEMLVTGVIDSGYMALLLYAAYNVLGSLIAVVFAQPSASGLHLVRVRSTRLLDLLRRLLGIAAIGGWLVFTMQRFRVFRPVYGFVESVVTHKFSYGEFSVSLGDVIAFTLAVFIAFWAARLVRVLLQQDVLSKMSLPRGVANSIGSLAYYCLLMAGLLAALSVAGVKVSQLALLFGALGVGIGLGLQDVVKNFVSGLILMFERPVQPGDMIEVEGVGGQVRDIGMRATVIRTFEGADMVVPNGMLLSEKLTNWTLHDRSRRFEFDLGVAYGSDPAAVAQLLAQVTRGMPGVAAEPAPQVLFQGYGDNALNFKVRAWTQDFDHWVELRSDLVGRLYAALGQAGIEIPFPQRDLHLRTVSDEVRDAFRPSPGSSAPPPAPAPPGG